MTPMTPEAREKFVKFFAFTDGALNCLSTACPHMQNCDGTCLSHPNYRKSVERRAAAVIAWFEREQ